MTRNSRYLVILAACALIGAFFFEATAMRLRALDKANGVTCHDEALSYQQRDQIDYLNDVYTAGGNRSINGQIPAGMVEDPPKLTINPTTCAHSFSTPYPAQPVCRDFNRLTAAQKVGVEDLVAFWKYHLATSAAPTDNVAVINPKTCLWAFGNRTPIEGVVWYETVHSDSTYYPGCHFVLGDKYVCTPFPGSLYQFSG